MEDDSVPGACTYRWNENEGNMNVDNNICWPSHVIETAEEEDEGANDSEEGGGDDDDDDDDDGV